LNTFTLILRNGNQIQVPFTERKGKFYISDHLSVDEVQCPDGSPIVIFKPNIDVFEETRRLLGFPIYISRGGFCRSKDYQLQLIKRGVKAAKKLFPHVEGAGRDMSPDLKHYILKDLIAATKQASINLGLPAPRLGYMAYGNSFLHSDHVFLRFAPYTNIPNPDPVNWAPGVEW
jgi:hypothetical protein